jgi:hypothetical protein
VLDSVVAAMAKVSSDDDSCEPSAKRRRLSKREDGEWMWGSPDLHVKDRCDVVTSDNVLLVFGDKPSVEIGNYGLFAIRDYDERKGDKYDECTVIMPLMAENGVIVTRDNPFGHREEIRSGGVNIFKCQFIHGRESKKAANSIAKFVGSCSKMKDHYFRILSMEPPRFEGYPPEFEESVPDDWTLDEFKEIADYYGPLVARIIYHSVRLGCDWFELEPEVRKVIISKLRTKKIYDNQNDNLWLSVSSSTSIQMDILPRLSNMLLTKDNCTYFIKNHIPLPIDFILFRPYIKFDASCMLFLKTGSETAVTILDRGSMSYTNAAERFSVYVNIRFDLGTVIRRPKNLHFFPDVFVSSYISGAGHQFFQHDNDIYSDQCPNDMFCMAIRPQDQPKSVWTSLTGDMTSALCDVDDTFGSYASKEIYAKKWKWQPAMNHLLEPDYYFKSQRPDVVICTQSGQYVYNPATKTTDKPVPGKCPLGDWPDEDTFDVLRNARNYNGHGIRGGMNMPLHRLLPSPSS